MQDTSLFSAEPRRDDGPAPYAQRAYGLLDRSALPSSARVRRELDLWYARLPEAAARSIKQRFVSTNDTVHLGAFFEIYLHELALRLCDDVDLDVGRDRTASKRPDLSIRCEGETALVEATAVTGHDFHSPQEQLHLDQVYDAVNAVAAPAFGVDVDVETIGAGTPATSRITKLLQRWLDSLDPDVLFAAQQRGEDHPETTLRVGDWCVRVSAYALAPEHRDYPHHRVVGGRSFGGGGIDDVKPIKKRLRSKASHYGEMPEPFVVAMLCAGTFVDDRDINKALFGRIGYRHDAGANELVGERQRDGVWMHDSGPVHTRLSAVLTFPKLSPHSICAVEPTLWTNPWASRPLTRPWPWRWMEGHASGRVVEHAATRSIADVLGLPERWPVEGVEPGG